MHLFVYGTLQRNQVNHHYLKSATPIGEATSVDGFHITLQRTPPDYPDGYPIATPNTDAPQLKGEIYEIDQDTLEAIDELEDYPYEYIREERGFTLSDGREVKALIYIGNTKRP